VSSSNFLQLTCRSEDTALRGRNRSADRSDMVGMGRDNRSFQTLAPPTHPPFDRPTQPVFLPEPLNLLVVDDKPFPPQGLVRLAAALPRMLTRNRFECFNHLGIIPFLGRIGKSRPADLGQLVAAPSRDPLVTKLPGGLTSTAGGQKFPLSTSFIASIYRSRSATIRLRRTFSFSNSRSRRTSATSIWPYLLAVKREPREPPSFTAWWPVAN